MAPRKSYAKRIILQRAVPLVTETDAKDHFLCKGIRAAQVFAPAGKKRVMKGLSPTLLAKETDVNINLVNVNINLVSSECFICEAGVYKWGGVLKS